MNDRFRSQYAVWAGSVGDRTPGPGGWSSIVVEQSTGLDHALVSGGNDVTKASTMELTAVVMGLSRVPHSSTVTVLTSSNYVLDTVGLIEEGWTGGGGEDAEIWFRLSEECSKRNVAWQRLDEGKEAPHGVRALTFAKAAAKDIA